MSKQIKQIFIFLGDVKGCHLPIAGCWLPEKTYESYYICLLLLLLTFRSKKNEISAITGRQYLRIKQISVDFEYSIHKAWGGLFKLKEHYLKYVTNQYLTNQRPFNT